MEKRARRAHGIGSRKISVSITEDDLRVLVARAKSLHRGNVSAALHDMVETLRREQALDQLLGGLGGDRVTDRQVENMRNEIATAALPRARRRSAA